MREIKFRAWDVESSCMVYDFQSMHDWEWHWDETKYLVMQYTGLLDKNGVEIYEGDTITSVTDGYGDNETMTVSGSVYWDDEDASFMIWGWGRTLGQVVQKEVIGNKYEAPFQI